VSNPVIIPAMHRMYALQTLIDIHPNDVFIPELVIAWAIYPTEHDGYDEPNPITIGGEMDQRAEGLNIHFSEDRSNLLKMVKRIAEKNEVPK
jgi:hypothetical protein